MRFSALIIATVICMLGASIPCHADDLNAFKQLAKSNAMIIMDTSGSMSWPVYDPNIDYAEFMRWMRSNGLATDAENAQSDDWWGNNNDYTKLDPNAIYLVKSPVGHNFINYKAQNGTDIQASAIGDVMTKMYADYYNFIDDWLQGAIIECKNNSNGKWKISEPDSIDIEELAGKKFIVFPKGTLSNLIPTGSVTVGSEISGRLKNNQDIELSKTYTDPLTGQTFDHGFIGFLKSSGFYFSGLFEKKYGDIDFTTLHSNMVTDTVYIFATGNWLNFIKLVEDFRITSNYSCTTTDKPYSYLNNVAWKYICFTDTIAQNFQPKLIMSHNTEQTSDYSNSPEGWSERGTIDAGPYAKNIKIKFDYIDFDLNTNKSGNDYIEIYDLDKNKILYEISGRTIGNSIDTYLWDDRYGWTLNNSFLDSEGYTPTLNTKKVRIRWRNGSIKNISLGAPHFGFKISGYKYTPKGEGYTCCGGPDGTGYKIKSRMDVAKAAMINAVEQTEDTINWGLSRFNGGAGATELAPLGTSPTTVTQYLENLEPGGATPLGEALQDAYNFNKTYLSTNPDAAECSANFMLIVTDGFPSDDGNWSKISGKTFKQISSGQTLCGASNYGDADVWPDSDGNLNNFTDDVAHWMYNCADFTHTTHSIAFGLDNPMLNDIAESSNGIYITALNEEQLMNAFYSLGLSMTNAISFAAPAISVDEENRAQAGDELYMAFFRPTRADYWQGNLKRFKISWNATKETIVDQFGNDVTDTDGSFIESSRSYWSTENDGGQINRGGAGGVLQDKVTANFISNPYDRMLYTHKGGALTALTKLNMDPADLGVSTDEQEAKIINFIYGYTYDADASGNPTAVRDWVLGDIIHSEPLVIDYVDSSPKRVLTNRYIVIGSNHGVLHVFDTETGEELFGFIPPNLLPSLKYFAELSDTHYYGIDGQIAKFQTGRNPDLMVFGLRRGGRAYYAIDISNPATSTWDMAWSINNETPGFSELGQTWSKVYFSTMPQTNGTILDIGVFTGGYDPTEDSNSTSFLPQGDSQGRGIFVVNATDGSLVFKCTFDTTNSTSDPTAFTRTDMKYSFPADPRVIRLPEGHKDGDLVIYAVDVASQLWKMLYDKDASPQWQVHRIFNSNGPTNTEGGADVASGLSAKLENTGLDSATLLDSTDIGRKSFSQPDVSYAGDCATDNPVIYFGTGDRENPLDTTVSHRFYAVYDMSTNDTNSIYYNLALNEADLLNVSDVSSNSSNPTRQLGDEYNATAQGWYIKFDEQNDASNHTGEKMTSSPRLFNKIIFFSTYKPTFDDVCAPNGDSFLYAIKYCSGMPAYEWVDSSGKPTRYQLHKNSPLASSWRIMAKEGVAAGKISVGSKLINIPIEIPSGLSLIWWDYN
ncbi:von Willebrand factor type A domain-containing protein [Desulfomicrobium norvegicum]|uniref:von Willebrand factor type A domain-containing protein n=1 Tax=Desulfomicrobium norvegicum (strain DSM 1741 / NCIMB 8310) TaxID=52561 RepID=A0A8G2C4J2_DESNO|nr:PilC/PilY family type IV pilus protein [Desulfomicrobium norvegicum]SFL97816.1 von Willebrand factor type A domain-containing protein [Desulfomicrobium norvegicum]